MPGQSPNRSTEVTRKPLLFENWRAAQDRSEVLLTTEYPSHSDCEISGGTKRLGPYQFINTLAQAARPRSNTLAPVLVLRATFHTTVDTPDRTKTDTSTYHAGGLADEAAALVALALGARFEAGPSTREHRPGDQESRPIGYYRYQPPVLREARFVPSIARDAGIP